MRRKIHSHRKSNSKVISADDMTLHAENSKDSSKTGLDQVIKIKKVVGYKIRIQKSVVFLYYYKKLSTKEIKRTIPLTIASKTKEDSWINLTKRGEILVHWKLQIIDERNLEDTNSLKRWLIHGLEDIILLKYP